MTKRSRVTQHSRLYRLIEKRLDDSTLAEFVGQRRARASWEGIAEEIGAATDIEVSGETLRRWFADRITVEVKVA